MSLTRANQLQLLQYEIATAALSRVSVDEIERSLIAPSSCPEDDKTALRLYAFSFLSRFEQRRIALDRLCAAQRELKRSPTGADVRRTPAEDRRLPRTN